MNGEYPRKRRGIEYLTNKKEQRAREIIIILLEEAAEMFRACDPKLDEIAKERVGLAAEKLGIIKKGAYNG